MLSYIDNVERLHTRSITFTEKQYLFVLQTALGEDIEVAYAMIFDTKEFKRVIGTEDEAAYLSKIKKDAELAIQSQECQQLKELIEEQFRAEIQKRATNLKNYKFSAEEIVQMLSNLLASRSENLEEASVRDITALIRELASQGALEGGDGFQKHFINVYPPFTAMCPSCNHEIDIARGVSSICPFCGCKFTWSEDEQRFYPQPVKL